MLDLAARAQRGITLSEAASALTAPISSVQHLLNGLVATGFLRERERRYTLGLAPALLALVGGRALPWIDQRELDRLGRVAGIPITLATRVGSEVIYLARSGSDLWPASVHIIDDHLARPLLGTAAGRLLLAFTDPTEREDILSGLQVDQSAEVDAFREELPTIRKNRYARSEGLTDPGARALAIPVIEAGKVTAALVLFAAVEQPGTTDIKLDIAAHRVHDAWAKQLSDMS
ncbi:DNA-binding IclR family transcriptional regulator [Microbacterium resistens]|uniref:DNA-binding IclR family transcriptional regulator n=1 Tax=Microbacterium resistens TaxID=156977 RepID=A0ABU1S826_9MICO|nr:DNA-binding IclR family transcriptional regulator [Microbacterium resistens]